MKLKMLFTIIPITMCVIVGNTYAAEGEQSFGGLTLGIGLSLTMDTGKRDRVDEAKVVNNIVRVTEESNDISRIMLESHYFFTPDFNFKTGFDPIKPNNWGHGPFVAIQPGTENMIEAIALGWMIGFKKEGKTNNSWNVGVGAVVDPNAKVLGSGIKENQPLPTGETEVRLKKTSQWGFLILTSFSF